MGEKKKNWVLSLLVDNIQNRTHAENRCNFNFLSWSQYDRVNIIEVNTFKDLCTKSASVKSPNAKWNGTERNLHLIPDEKVYNSEFTWCLSNNKTLIKVDEETESDFGLFTVLTLRYDDNLSLYKNDISFKELSVLIREEVYKFLNEFINENYAGRLTYFPFYSLDSEDLVLIFLSDELESVYQCVEYVKSITYLDSSRNDKCVFSSLSVFPGLNIEYFKSNPNIDAIIKISLQPNVNTKVFLQQINDYFKTQQIDFVNKIYVRNSCIYFELIGNENILSLYHVNGLLNGVEEFYRDNIKSSRTYWVRRNELTDIENFNINFPESKITSIEWDKYSDIKRPVDYNPDVSVTNKVAKFILSEYDRLIDTAKCTAWLPILSEQRDSINSYVKILEQDNDNDTLCRFLNYCQTSLTYINQACSPLYEVPYHNYYYHSSFNDILKMYYGIISSIIKIGKSFHHESQCNNKITFAVNFEAATKIHSMHYSYNNEQFVFFHIPYENFYDYTLTIPALIHEVFHYIVPYSNEQYNKILVSLIVKKIMNVIKTRVINEDIEMDDVSRHKIVRYWDNEFEKLNKLVTDYVEQSLPEYFELTNSELKSIFFSDEKSFESVYKGVINYVCDFIKKAISYVDSDDEFAKTLSKYSDFTLEDLGSIDFYNLIMQNGLLDFVNDILSGTKEAFCDVFILKILNINFADYIKLLFNILVRTSNLSNLKNYLLDCDFYSNVLAFETITIRVNVLIEYFYKQEIITQNKEKVNIVSWFLKEINSIIVDNNKETFELFKNFLIDRFRSYQQYFGEYNAYIYMMAVGGVGEWNISDYPELIKIKDNLTEFYSNPNDDINIELMTNFIYFYDNSVCESFVEGKIKEPKIKTTLLKIQSLEEYIKAVRNIIKYHSVDYKLWFRGVCNKSFKVTPSLFRNIDHNLSLYTNQANILKVAYEKTLSFNEIWSKSIVEQMALLQHYGVPTNLLDFSMDMLVALHFALTPDLQIDKDRINSGKYKPVVYIFDPVVYSEAVNELKKDSIIEDSSLRVSPIVYDINNSSEMNGYFINCMSYDFLYEHTQSCLNKDVEDYEFEFPIPIIVRQSNDRIHSQNGVFLAYSLDSIPQKNSEPYVYLALDNLQNLYNDFRDRKGAKRRTFLYSICIEPSCVNSIKNDLKTLNISEGKFYPEIVSVLKDAMCEYKETIDSRNAQSSSNSK